MPFPKDLHSPAKRPRLDNTGGRPIDTAGRPIDTAGRPNDTAGRPNETDGRPIDTADRPNEPAEPLPGCSHWDNGRSSPQQQQGVTRN